MSRSYIPPKYSVSSFMGFLKGKSSLMIYSKWANMRYQYRNRERILCGYSRKEYEENKRIYSKSTKRGPVKSTNDI